MAWIQRNGKRVVKRDGHIKVLTPAGFPVYQAYMTDKRIEIKSEMLGTVRVYVNRSTDEPSLVKHNNGISPNLIHSLDSTHMIRIINSTHKATGTNSFSMIHDEYGTHPKYMNEMSKIARDEFFNLYKHDVLADWKEQLSIDEPLPEYGKFDIGNILSAMNAFI
jgi:DNA-directed RNA polymerase